MSRSTFDPFIHTQPRLAIFALLSPADWVEFVFIRESAEISDSALSKQISLLQEAGHVDVRKDRRSGRRTTYIRLTETGRAAFLLHVAALEEIVRSAHTSSAPPED